MKKIIKTFNKRYSDMKCKTFCSKTTRRGREKVWVEKSFLKASNSAHLSPLVLHFSHSSCVSEKKTRKKLFLRFCFCDCSCTYSSSLMEDKKEEKFTLNSQKKKTVLEIALLLKDNKKYSKTLKRA
jgi:hypothetical protein